MGSDRRLAAALDRERLMLATVLVRTVAIVAGYVLACLAASAFLNFASLGVLGLDGLPLSETLAATLFFAIPFIALFVGYFAIVPALCVAGLGEVLGRRDALFYALGGGTAGLVVAGYLWRAGTAVIVNELGEPSSSTAAHLAVDDPRLAAMLVAAGIAGGIAYWLVAGRGAVGIGRSRT
jgi:hypothetical protein